jgi:hypothetical protein
LERRWKTKYKKNEKKTGATGTDAMDDKGRDQDTTPPTFSVQLVSMFVSHRDVCQWTNAVIGV